MSYEPISFGSTMADPIITVSEPQIPNNSQPATLNIQKQKVPKVPMRELGIPNLGYIALGVVSILGAWWLIKKIAEKSSEKDDKE